MLERAAVAVPHQVVDQALGALRVLGQLRQRLLARGGDPGRPQHVGVRGAVLDELDGHVVAELGRGLSGSRRAEVGGHRRVLPVGGFAAASLGGGSDSRP